MVRSDAPREPFLGLVLLELIFSPLAELTSIGAALEVRWTAGTAGAGNGNGERLTSIAVNAMTDRHAGSLQLSDSAHWRNLRV